MILNQTVIFCAAHRIQDCGTICENIHGHNYTVVVTISGYFYNNGMIIDFFDLEKLCKQAIEEYDHALILKVGDPIIEALSNLNQKIVVLNDSPTCEIMVMDIRQRLENIFKANNLFLKIDKVKLKEMDQYEVEG